MNPGPSQPPGPCALTAGCEAYNGFQIYKNSSSLKNKNKKQTKHKNIQGRVGRPEGEHLGVPKNSGSSKFCPPLVENTYSFTFSRSLALPLLPYTHKHEPETGASFTSGRSPFVGQGQSGLTWPSWQDPRRLVGIGGGSEFLVLGHPYMGYMSPQVQIGGCTFLRSLRGGPEPAGVGPHSCSSLATSPRTPSLEWPMPSHPHFHHFRGPEILLSAVAWPKGV